MIYAPIIIPTLNRAEHLKRCIGSLAQNNWAKYTDLIISVDYPPKESYKEGYKNVCNYLSNTIEGFRKVEIIYQEKNLGAYYNTEFLKKHIYEKYDRYIYTEDDNEFSPNFIEFIDKGLELFKNDDKIVGICPGSLTREETEENNIFLTYNFAAYGYGTWIKKEKQYYETITRDYCVSLAYDSAFLRKIAKENYGLFFAFQDILFQRGKLYCLEQGKVPIIDQTIKLYLIKEKKYVVGACERKVRNWGYDGSGVNCPKVEKWQIVDIDKRAGFEYHYNLPMKIEKPECNHTLELYLRILIAFIKIGIWKIRKRA